MLIVAVAMLQVTWMLIVVVAMFGVCWIPLHLFNVALDFHPYLLYTSDENTLQAVFFACHWLAMSHASINPIIYIIADSEFRVSTRAPSQNRGKRSTDRSHEKIVPFNFCKGIVKACKGLVNVLYSL